MSTQSIVPRKIDITVLPVDVEIDGCLVTILEAAKLQLPWDEFQVSCQVRCGNLQSQIFHLTYKTPKELAQKLKTEVAKFKYMMWLLGEGELVKRGIATKISAK
jgi:hypothetical protein